MIKFFSSIRKKLVADKPSATRTTNYLKYAIGEIVLVMIGILLALQVNNWNEERQNTKLEKLLLTRLAQDLKAQIEEIDISTQHAYKIIATGNTILGKMGESYSADFNSYNDKTRRVFFQKAIVAYKDSLNTLTFGQSLGSLCKERSVDLFNFTYKEILSTGDFDVIKNQKIKEHLSQYYLLFTDLLDIQGDLFEAVDDYKNILTKNNIPIVNTLSYNDVMLKIKDQENFNVILKNLIWGTAHSISLFEKFFKKSGNDLIVEIEKYKKQL